MIKKLYVFMKSNGTTGKKISVQFNQAHVEL